MYRNTRFGELLKGLPRGSFEKIVDAYQGDKHSKGFRSWDQLVAMIYSQLSGCRSLRELEAGFNSQAVHHYHLGTREIKRSTLADANTKRDCGLFEQVCGQLLQRAHRKLRGELKDLLYLMDSTPIPLKGLGYDAWTKDTHCHRTRGLKVHLLYAPSAAMPIEAEITPANVNDIQIGRSMPVERGATYVFDKGYCDYNWWREIDLKGAFFVTRFKKNAGVEQVEAKAIPEEVREIIREDAIVRFKCKRPGGKRVNHYYGEPLRRVVVNRPDKATPLILVTNDMKRSAHEIAELYKQRWGIELFFKWLKQNLRIKQFLGRNENAVKIQIYTALITYLLAQSYRLRQGVSSTLKLWLVELRSGLFQRPEVERETARRRRRRRMECQELQGVLAL